MGTDGIFVSEQAMRVKQLLVGSSVPFDMSNAQSVTLPTELGFSQRTRRRRLGLHPC